jgi:tRNA(Ser,Leu) C12 N-acetylase TAN1
MSDEYSRTVRLSEDLSYVQPTAPLPSWLKGFFVTAVSKGQERVVDAAIEASNILNDYWFKVAYDAHRIDGEKPYERAEAMWIPGCDACAFVALRPDDNDANVYMCAKAIVEECRKGADWKQPTHVARIVPVEKSSSELELDALARDVLPKHFPPRGDSEPITFGIHYEEHSPMRHFSSTDVNRVVGSHVPDEGYKVDLKNPRFTICVVNAGGSMMMSVVEAYDALGHFNIHRAAFEDKLSDTVPGDDSAQPAA